MQIFSLVKAFEFEYVIKAGDEIQAINDVVVEVKFMTE